MPSTTCHLDDLLQHIDRAAHLQITQWPDRASGFEEVNRLAEELARKLLVEPTSDQTFAPEPTTAEMLQQQGVFLGGSPKGGTTMLVQLFDNHPECVVIPGDSRMVHLLDASPEETEIGKMLGFWLRKPIAPNALPPFWGFGRELEPYRQFAHAYRFWRGELAARPSGCFLAAVFAMVHASTRTAVTHFVEKTCSNVLKPDRVFDEYPLAKMIHIVRDPYTTLAALDKQTKVRAWDWAFHARLDHVQLFLEAALANPDRFGAERYQLVSYERLVAEPEPTMRECAAFVGIDYHPTLTTPTVLGHAAHSNSMFVQRQATGQLVAESREAGHHRWSEAFTNQEQETILRRIGDLASELGYPPPVSAGA